MSEQFNHGDSLWMLVRKILQNLKIIADAGSSPSGVTGPVISVSGNIATFNGVTGQIIQDSGIAASSIVTNTSFQAGSQAIGSGVDTISVVFPVAFAVAPVVVANISRPVAEGILTWNIDKASITTLGFTASLGATTDSANYFLEWMAK